MIASHDLQSLQCQSPSAVVMVRPHHFQSNPETLADNAFQRTPSPLTRTQVAELAFLESTRAAEVLRQSGVIVHLFDDKDEMTPDSVFPNNWFSTHTNGALVLYPMYCANRRQERRADILQFLSTEYHIDSIIDYSSFEQHGHFLEGTGSMVIDHVGKVVYAARSKRMSEEVLKRFCKDLDLEQTPFDATDENGVPVYHTNVMMSIGSAFAVIGSDLISSPEERHQILQKLRTSGREVIELTNHQIHQFAANVLELQAPDGKVLALSKTAYESITEPQKAIILKHARFAVLDIPTIEMAGGSVRCMLAGIHLSRRMNP